MEKILFCIGIYLLIGALLYLYMILKCCSMSGLRFNDIVFTFEMKTTNGKRIKGVYALIIFIIIWPKLLPLIFNIKPSE